MWELTMMNVKREQIHDQIPQILYQLSLLTCKALRITCYFMCHRHATLTVECVFLHSSTTLFLLTKIHTASSQKLHYITVFSNLNQPIEICRLIKIHYKIKTEKSVEVNVFLFFVSHSYCSSY